MPRVNVWLPEELFSKVRAMEHVNVSRLLQDKLRELLRCDHMYMACRDCALPIDKWAVINERMREFYDAILTALYPLVQEVGTAEGACRVIKDVAVRFQVPGASTRSLPRPSRSNLAAAGHTAVERRRRMPTQQAKTVRAKADAAVVAAADRALPLPVEDDSRRRHPTANTSAPAPAITTPNLDVEESA